TQAGMLALIGPHLGESFLPEVLSEVEQILDGNGERCKALLGLAPFLDEGLLRVALGAASRIEDHRSRAAASAGLISRLAESGFATEALALAQKISVPSYRVEALCGVIEYLNEEMRAEALEETVSVALDDDSQPNNSLSVLCERLRSSPESVLS